MTKICPVCSSVTLPYAVADLATPKPMFICPDCRHIGWQQKASETELADYYQKQYASDHSQRDLQEQGRRHYKGHAQELPQKLKQFGNGKAKPVIVDYGCAWPVFAQEARKSGLYARVIGVDYDAQTIKAGRDLDIDMYTPEEMFNTLKDHAIDIIRFSHVLEHMIDPLGFLQKLYPKMAAGGMIYITQPVFPVLKTDTPPPHIKDAVYPEHLHFFTMLSMTAMLEKAGFTVYEMAAFQNEKEVEMLFSSSFDQPYATQKLARYQPLTPSCFEDEGGGFPLYYGENMTLYAIKKKPWCKLLDKIFGKLH